MAFSFFLGTLPKATFRIIFCVWSRSNLLEFVVGISFSFQDKDKTSERNPARANETSKISFFPAVEWNELLGKGFLGACLVRGMDL